MGTERVNGIQIEGICGAKSANGSGSIAAVVQAFNPNGTNGMPVSIYDHEGMYLEGNC